MVNSEVSGIAFSVHPVTEDRNQLIIEAGFGLGEAIVSGSITPDSYVVEKEPRKILDINVSTQERKLIRKEEGGNEWVDISEPEASSQVLTEKQISELAQIIIGIENHYGFPCDIEWAFEAGKFYIVQSRPITTLSNIPVSKIVSYKKGDYVLTFWAKGVSPLVTDISREGYVELEVLYIIDNGIFKQYFPKKAYERALDEGLEFYKNARSVEGYQQALNDHIKSFEDFFLLNIKDKQTIPEKDVAEFFKYAVRLSKEYLKMGFEYTDKAFAHQDENEVLKKNLTIVSKYKDEVREFVNKVFFKSENFLLSLLQILSKQFSLSLSILENSTQQELLNLFKGIQLDTDKIQKRRESFVCIYNNPVPFEGAEAETIVDIFTEKVSNTDEIKGQTASRGKISGKVKIIPVDYSDFTRINNEIKKMDQGDILVAETTAPELIVACKKAGAIITDMGGLMSHAAIVSREFGIPCIVGTGNASKILKDGDVVEVDADNGIVRILLEDSENDNNNLSWHSISSRGRNHAVFIIDSVIHAIIQRYDKEIYNFDLNFHEYRQIDKKREISEKDYQEVILKLSELAKNNPQILVNIPTTTLSFIKSLEKKIKQWEKQEVWKEESSWPIILNDFFILLSKIWSGAPGYSYIFLGEKIAPLFVQEVTKENLDVSAEEATLLLQPKEITEMSKLVQKLEKLAKMPQDKMSDKKISILVQKYGYLGRYYFWGNSYDQKTIKEWIRKIKSEKQSDKTKIIHKKVKLTSKQKVLRTAFQKYALMSNRADEITNKGIQVLQPLFHRIADTLEIKYEHVANMRFSEIIKSLEEKKLTVDKVELIRRTNDHLFWFHDGIIILNTQGEYDKEIQKQVHELPASLCELRGQNASVNKNITGVVKIIYTPQDIEKLKEGEILVTSMTNPEFLPAMQKALGFITDDGGLLCHAAIVARELGKTCIIGTKNATQVLKDGDVVEFDADNGIVFLMPNEGKK